MAVSSARLTHRCLVRPTERRLESLSPPLSAPRFRPHEFGDRIQVDRASDDVGETVVTVDRCLTGAPAAVRWLALARGQMDEERPAESIIREEPVQICAEHVAGYVDRAIK